MSAKTPSPDLARVRHVFNTPLTAGKLVRRYKRFLTDVELESGETIVAHCNNSGTLLSCLEPGAPVRLSPSDNPKRRTAFTWEMIKINRRWVGINTLVPNRLVAQAAKLMAHPLFAGAQKVHTERRVSDTSRLDVAVETAQGMLFVEVKNVTLMQNGQARFPDAKTTRGAKHLGELMRLRAEGARAAAVYVVQRMDCDDFAPADDIDPEYARLFHTAREKGVEVLVLQARVSPREIRLERELPLAV